MSQEQQSQTNFKPGDIVRLKGGVDEWTITDTSSDIWVWIKHDTLPDTIATFAKHVELIRRPKRKEKRTIERWVNVYSWGFYDQFYRSKDSADLCAPEDRVACVRLVGEYEVEVED